MSSWRNHLQSPGVPSYTQVRDPQSAMRHQEQPPVQGLWSPHSAMEVMNQSGQPRKSGKRRPMLPAPLTSGGLTLEEITCRGWGPHLQYSFLIKLASLSGKYRVSVKIRILVYPPIYTLDTSNRATVSDHGREHRVRGSAICACAEVIPTFTLNGVLGW